ncbi:MAG: hypothetical protein V3U11_13275 [Planctomycetota bacterium]
MKNTDTVEIQVRVFNTSGTMLCLITQEELVFFNSAGGLVEHMVIHRDTNGHFKSPETTWNVKGHKRNVPVAHILHGIVGQQRRVQYQSDDRRVETPRFDLRCSTHFVGEPGKKRTRRQRADAFDGMADSPDLTMPTVFYDTKAEALAALSMAVNFLPEAQFHIEEEKVVKFVVVRDV